MSTPDLCIYFVIGLVSVAYPILLQVIATLDEKYASIVIVELFKKELEYRFFRIFLVSDLCLIGLYAITNLSVDLTNLSWLSHLMGYGLLLVTALLLLTFLLFISKILAYYTPSKIVKYFISKKTDQNFEYFNALGDILYFAIDKNLDGIALIIHDYYYKAFAKIREQQKGKPVVYPYPYYYLVDNIVNRLASGQNQKFRFLEHRAIGGIWLLGELSDISISEDSYAWIWRMLMTAVTFKRDDMVMHWWTNAHQAFGLYMTLIQPNTTYDNGITTTHNKAEVNKRDLERERFLEFNFALGGMLLYKNRLDCIRRIFSYTSSTPPDYVLLPIYMNQIFRTFFKFWDAYNDVFPFINQRYVFPGTEGIKSDDLVKIWTCRYVSVLLLRQYTLVEYYTFMKPLQPPNVPTNKSERRIWVDNLSYFEEYVKQQYENRELLKELGWESMTDKWFTEHKKVHPVKFVQTVKKAAIETDDRIDKEQELDPDKVQRLKNTISKIICDTYNTYSGVFNQVVKSKGLSFKLIGTRTIMDKSEFAKDKVDDFANEYSITASGVARDLEQLVAGTFLMPNKTQINVKEEDLFKAIVQLDPHPDKYVIINFGFNISHYISHHKTDGLSLSDYKGLNLYTFPMGNAGRHLYIVRKDELPYLFTNKPIQPEIRKYKLEMIGDNNLYFSIIDLYRNEQVRNDWLLSDQVSDQQKANIEKMVQIYIGFLVVIQWKEETHLTSLSVVYGHGEQEKITPIEALEKLA